MFVMAHKPLHDPAKSPLPDASTETRNTTCYMCACRCGIRVHLRNGEVRYIDGNPDHPLNKGVICAKGSSGIMKQYSPARLTKPLMRKPGTERGDGQFVARRRTIIPTRSRLPYPSSSATVGASFPSTRSAPATRPLRSIKWSFLFGVFVIPTGLLAAAAGDSQVLLAPAFVVQYLGLMAERWFFFAQANHPQNLYYQVIA